MPLATSGALTLDQIHVEAGGTSGTTCSLNDSDIRGLTAASGRTINSTLGTNIDFADFYGAAGGPPDSFGKTGVTPATWGIVYTVYDVYRNTSKFVQTAVSPSGGTNSQFSETSEFTDSNGDTQEILNITHEQGKGANTSEFNIYLLGHNVSTSSWTLSYAGLSITGNSSITYGGITFNSPSTTNGSNTVSGVTYNYTQFRYEASTSTTNPFPTGSNQSWSIT